MEETVWQRVNKLASSRWCCSHCRQFVSSASSRVSLQCCDDAMWRSALPRKYFVNKRCSRFYLFIFFLVFIFRSIPHKLWSRLLCGEDSSGSEVGTSSHVQCRWNGRLPRSDLFLSAVHFRVWPESIVRLRLSLFSACTSGTLSGLALPTSATFDHRIHSPSFSVWYSASHLHRVCEPKSTE